MTLGTFLWKNTNPDQPHFGEEIIIDLDTLPTTTKRSNFIMPNVHEDADGQRYRIEYPLFYFAPDGEVFLSTIPPDIDAADNIIYIP